MPAPVHAAHKARSAAVGSSLLATLALLLALGLVLGCSGGSGEASSPPGADTSPSCDGPRTATSEVRLEPVVDRAEPQLPVTVTDASGQSVTVDDASRILALDTYGTLATTVFALGLGDHLVGRDV